MQLSGIVRLSTAEQRKRGLLFTPREIAQQPDTWRGTLDIFMEKQGLICNFLEQAGILEPLEKRPVVMLVGAGTSDYIGHALALLLRQKWACEVSAIASTDLLTNLEDYVIPGRKYLWISFSRSGDSPEAVAVLQQAIQLYPDVAHLVITCNQRARMLSICGDALHSCAVVLDDAVNDRSLAMTSSFSNMIVMGQCLANAWSIEEYIPVMDRLVVAGRGMLISAGREAERAAAKGFSSVCVVGSGHLASVAKETALKVLEMSAGQIKTMSETVLGLRHGPMAALDAQTLLVCFVSSEHRKQGYAIDLLTEIDRKGITGFIIAVGPASAAKEFTSCCDSYLSINGDFADMYRPVLDVIFGQLLGLYGSIAHELQPDAPSPGGVINRVVQEVTIY